MSHFLLRCFSQGAAIADIAGLTGHKPDDIETAIRADIRQMLQSADASMDAQPIPTALKKPAVATPYEPKPFVRPEPGTVVASDGVYPEALKDPRCTTMRCVWDALMSGPKTIDELFAAKCGSSRDVTYQTVQRLHGAGLVVVADDTRPAKWRRVERPKD